MIMWNVYVTVEVEATPPYACADYVFFAYGYYLYLGNQEIRFGSVVKSVVVVEGQGGISPYK